MRLRDVSKAKEENVPIKKGTLSPLTLETSRNKNGAILITTLWVITILTALCVSVAHRSAIALKLSSYQPDKVKAYFIARAGIFRALALKRLEYEKQRSHTIDALSQPWANDAEVFKNHSFAGGFYTLSYTMAGEGERGFKKSEALLYGLSDEASRLNINKAKPEMLTQLITFFDVDEDEAVEIACCIEDWRDEDSVIHTDNFGRLLGAEDEYYQGLDNPYPCKNADFEVIEELILVKGITPEIFYGSKDKKGKVSPGLKDFLTVYTDGGVNINTASERVLSALFGPGSEELAQKIAAYRRGRDGTVGTTDDRWFSIGPYVLERGEKGMVEVKNLAEGSWLGNIYGIDTNEYGRIKKMVQRENGIKITASSKVYRAIAEAEFEKVISSIEAVYEFDPEKETPAVKFWHQE